MATSFLICYPDIPVRALTWTASQTVDPFYPWDSTFFGPRWNYSQLSSNQTTMSVTYDLGTGNTATVGYFLLGGAQILLANGVTQATLEGSNNGSTWTTQLGTASGFQTRTFNGPDGDDVIFVPGFNDEYAATLAAYRYFKVTLAGGSAHKFPISKVYFGSGFDAGFEPATYDLEVTTEQDSDTWVYPRGQVIMSKAFHPRHKFTIEWDGLTDVKATSFATTILNNPYRDCVFLYASNFADPLYDNKLIYCRTVDDECSITKQGEDWNNIVTVFEESI